MNDYLFVLDGKEVYSLKTIFENNSGLETLILENLYYKKSTVSVV